MKTSTKVGWTLIGLLVAAGAVIAVVNPRAEADEATEVVATATPSEQSSASEPPSAASLTPLADWYIHLTGDMVTDGLGCIFYGHEEFEFLDLLPAGSVISVSGGSCGGTYQVVTTIYTRVNERMEWIESTYDLMLRYPHSLGYGYLLARRLRG